MSARFIYVVASGLPMPSPAYEELPPHPVIVGARVLPPDGRFTVDGEEWTVRGAAAVALGADRRPSMFVDPAPTGIEVVAPIKWDNVEFSVGFAAPSLIEKSDARAEVLTGFGLARRGSS